ncbi:MAG: glycerol-3-phosphate 1-O-acyltransferase PlsB [Sinobacterium sp.]|nr:glycerol-3-phosphate 1-O-acyltransferase PlsB [Sinobacterium sp.]
MQYFWLSIRYWLSQTLLKPFIKSTPLPTLNWDNLGKLSQESELCFIIDGFHAADRTAIEHTLQAASTVNKQRICFVYLPSSLDKKLSEKTLAHMASICSGKNIMLASVFWGRSANRSNGFFNTYFSQTYAPITILRRSITVLLKSRQVSCHISQTEYDNVNLDTLQQAREQLNDLRESVTGPDLSHKRTLLQAVIHSKEVTQCIDELVNTGEINREKAQKQAQKIYKEIAADYSYPAVRFFDVLLSVVWKKLYKGVEIHNFDEVTKIAQSHQIIYTPCHRSHIDYLLLSYTIYHQGLMPPHIAAGINLNLPVIGAVLRKAGAFFIRREFRGKKLYRAVLESYVNSMLEAGVPLEYFIEGGRSRTGLLLPARPGMLAMTVRSSIKPQKESPKKPIAIIPVYIGYEKLVESHSYINELYGSQKQKESISNLVAARKQLLLNYGKVYVNFSKPIYLDDIRKSASPVLSSQELTTYCVDALSQKIPVSINKAAIITPANLVATALLSSNRHALLKEQLKQQMRILQGICTINKALDISSAMSTEQSIEHCLNIDFIQTQEKNWGEIFLLDQKGKINATFLRNNTLHNFIVPSIIASVLIKHNRIHKKKIINTCRRLLPFIQSELYIDLGRTGLTTKVQQYLDLLTSKNLLTKDDEYYCTHSSESESYYQLSLLAGSSKAAIERFYIAAQCLLQAEDKHYTRNTLENNCIELAQQLALLHTFHAPDFFDKNLFRTFIKQLIQENIIIEDDHGLLSSKNRLKLSAELASQVLSKHAQRNIKQLAYRPS